MNKQPPSRDSSSITSAGARPALLPHLSSMSGGSRHRGRSRPASAATRHRRRVWRRHTWNSREEGWVGETMRKSGHTSAKQALATGLRHSSRCRAAGLPGCALPGLRGGGGVEGVEAPVLVGVVDQLVQILEPAAADRQSGKQAVWWHEQLMCRQDQREQSRPVLQAPATACRCAASHRAALPLQQCANALHHIPPRRPARPLTAGARWQTGSRSRW